MLSQILLPTNLARCCHQSLSRDPPRRKDGIFARISTSGEGGGGGISRGKAGVRRQSNWANYGGSMPAILCALESIFDVGEALGPWKETLSNKERTIILKEQVKWERAVEIFEWFGRKGCYELNVIHYNVMLRILGQSRQWRMVERLWLEMREKGIGPNNSTYSTLIDVSSKGGLAKEGLVWWGDMIKQGLEPDKETAGTIVLSYKKTSQFGAAHEFFWRWLSSREDDSVCLRCYDVQTFNLLIDMYGKAGKLKEASKAFAEMLKLGVMPDRITFNTMIHICGNYGRLDEVAALVGKMEELRCWPDTRTYNILVAIYAKGGDIGKASWYFSEMKRMGLEPDTVGYRTLLYAYSIRHMVGEAESLVTEMEKGGFEMDEYIQSSMTRMYLDVGLLEKAWSWFEKFQETMLSDCYAAHVDAFAGHGHLSFAEKAFSRCLSRQKSSALVFNVMIKAYGIAKNYEKVCDTIDGMKKYGISPDKCTFLSVVKFLSAAGLPWRATQYVRKMQLAGFIDDCFPYCVVISSFARLGKLGMAEELFREMVRFGIQPDIILFGVLINAFAEAGNVEKAEKYVESLRCAGYPVNSVILSTLIKLYTKVGYLQEAQKTYNKARLLDDGPGMYSSNCMIELFAEHNMIHEAEKVFADLKQRGETTEFSYAMMLCLYNKLGQFKEGFDVAREMIDRNLLGDVLSYTAIIELFSLNGRSRDAANMFRQMLNSGMEPNDSTFRSLGTGLVWRGISKDAVDHLELIREKNHEKGLLVWLQTLKSVLHYNDSSFKFGRKFKRLPQT